jgi:hypothetical protein
MRDPASTTPLYHMGSLGTLGTCDRDDDHPVRECQAPVDVVRRMIEDAGWCGCDDVELTACAWRVSAGEPIPDRCYGRTS